MHPLPLRSIVREFWDLIGDGMSPRQAGVAVGVSERTGQDDIVIVEQV